MRAGKSLADFYTELGELALQLAVVVVIGALIKAVADWGTSQRRRHAEKLETRILRRVRALYVTVANARDLMNAHRTPKTYRKQSRRLMLLRPANRLASVP